MATYRPGSNTLLKSDSILEYVLDTTVYPREHERLRELRLITQNHPKSFMGSSPDQMQFFSVLLKMIGARNAVEVGVFTGYSLLATALALPDDGKVVAIDVSREYYELGRPVIEDAGVAHKVDFRHGDGLAVLDQLLAGGKGKFDFAYADADKEQYRGYHERLVRLLRVGGLVAYDNTLWGRVRGNAARHAGELGVRPRGARLHGRVQRHGRRRRPRRGMPAPRRRRRHAVPPPQVRSTDRSGNLRNALECLYPLGLKIKQPRSSMMFILGHCNRWLIYFA
ncbi:hypothetical protein OsJ_27816 [Oryza sativa Japonica Group]|uniref:Caffeoyl-CoA O-methyltransferase n=1 Tax=Oryza sativa subsp. japonica TaxID=39947 RepID=B9G1M2_ORYSJ|nr:hypothetical protein OsJ_27816 [Oryza sativa Japonica Group]